MLDLDKIVSDAVKDMVDTGELENEIKETVQKTIKSIVNDYFRGYSDFGRDVKDKIKSSLQVNLDKLDLPTYDQLILDQITDAVNANVKCDGEGSVFEIVRSILEGGKEAYNLSEIIEEFKSEVLSYSNSMGIDKDEIEDGDCISLFIEQDNSYSTKFTHIYIDARSEIDRRFNCRYQIDMMNNKPYSISSNGAELRPISVTTGRTNKFDLLLLKIFTNGASIELDKGEKEYSYDLELEIDEEEA